MMTNAPDCEIEMAKVHEEIFERIKHVLYAALMFAYFNNKRSFATSVLAVKMGWEIF